VHPTRSSSEPTLHSLLNISHLGRLWATSDDLHGDELNSAKALPKRCVVFQPVVRVVLIPSRREYAAADLLTTLWWEDSDYSFFKATAVSELRALMIAKGITNLREAIKDLYQPCKSEMEIETETECRRNSPRSFVSTASSSPTSVNTDSEKTPNPRRLSGCKKPSMILIEARTDVELNEMKRCHDAELSFEVRNVVHPIVYMCQ
jgi:hypothetical protein